MRSALLARLVAIIGAVLALAGCGTTQLAYNNAPQLAWWWLDGYFDVAGDQAPRVKVALERYLAWHRSTQLEGYAAWLAALRERAGDKLTGPQVCELYDQGRQRLQPALDRLIASGAELVDVLKAPQIDHFEQRLAKANAEYRSDFLQADPEERRRAALKRALKRVEDYYGRVEPAQRAALVAGVAKSPFDPELAMAERQRRQQDTLKLLRGWLVSPPTAAAARQALGALAARAERPTDPAYRAYQERLVEHNCRLTAEVHSLATPAQRDALRERLKEWEDDLRSLARTAAP